MLSFWFLFSCLFGVLQPRLWATVLAQVASVAAQDLIFHFHTLVGNVA